MELYFQFFFCIFIHDRIHQFSVGRKFWDILYIKCAQMLNIEFKHTFSENYFNNLHSILKKAQPWILENNYYNVYIYVLKAINDPFK